MAEVYLDEKRSLYCLDHIINLVLNNKSFQFKAGDSSNNVNAINVKTITISEKEGVYITGTIVEKGNQKFRDNTDDKVTVVPPEYFDSNKKLRERLENYIEKRPRLRVIRGSFDINGEMIDENMVICLMPKPSDNKMIKSTSYEVVKLYDDEGVFMATTMDKAKDYEARERLYQKATIQGRFNDPAMYDAITLALRGYTRGLVKDGVIYSRVMENGEPKHIPIASSNFNPLGYSQGPVEDKIELERFGCSIKTRRYNNQSGQTVNYIRLTNLLGDEGRFEKYYDIINKIKNKQFGLVYLKNTLAEEVISTFYPCINPLTTKLPMAGTTTVGAYISQTGETLSHCNPDLEIIPISYDKIGGGNNESSKTILSDLGITDNSMDFYIIEANISIDPDVLSAMSDHSLVFILSEFGDLSGLTRQLNHSKDTLLFVEKLIFAGSLQDDEGIFIHPYIKQLMRENDIHRLKRIPLYMSKRAIDGSMLRLSDMIARILQTEEKVSEIVLTNQVQIVKDDIIQKTNSTYEELTYGELLYIYMQLTNYDMYSILNKYGIYNRIIKYPIKEFDSVNNVMKNYEVPFKLTVTELRNTIGKPPIKLSLVPVRTGVSESCMSLATLFTEKNTGICLLCGEPKSGKRQVIQSICKNLPNKGRVLILDSEYEIIEDFFKNEDGADAMGLDLTISRSKNMDKIESMIQSKPDTIIVYKINTYSTALIEMILKSYHQSQQLILVYDGLFTDLIEDLSMPQVNRILDCIDIATNQVKIKTMDDEILSVYECIDRSIISTLSLSRNTNDSRELAGTIYNHMKDNAQGLNRQLAELNRNNKISVQVYNNACDILRRHYVNNNNNDNTINLGRRKY